MHSSFKVTNVSSDATKNITNIVNQPGSHLDKSTKQFMESRFGYDFSDVRIHDHESANRSTYNINALAYTVGNNIVFREGQYRPNTHDGRRLLAHELVHVIQNKSLEINYFGPTIDRSYVEMIRRGSFILNQHVGPTPGILISCSSSRPVPVTLFALLGVWSWGL